MSTIKINELATGNISLSDYLVKSNENGLATKYTVQELQAFLNTIGVLSVKGIIDTASAAPTEDGVYLPTEDGTYTNYGGEVISLDNNFVVITVFEGQTEFTQIAYPITLLNYVKFSDVKNTFDDTDEVNPSTMKATSDYVDLQITESFFYEEGANLVNENDPDYLHYKIMGSNGVIYDTPTIANQVSGYVPVSPNTVYTPNVKSNVIFVDESFTWLGGTDDRRPNNKFTTPATLAYVRLSATDALTEAIKLVKGDYADNAFPTDIYYGAELKKINGKTIQAKDTKTSVLENDANFQTEAEVDAKITALNIGDYLTESEIRAEFPTKTDADSDYANKQNLQDNYMLETDITTYVESEIAGVEAKYNPIKDKFEQTDFNFEGKVVKNVVTDENNSTSVVTVGHFNTADLPASRLGEDSIEESKLSPSVKAKLNATSPGASFSADDEDLELVETAPSSGSFVSKFKNRTAVIGGKRGKYIARSTFAASDVTGLANTDIEIRYIHDFGGATITMPSNASFNFVGGELRNCTIIGDETQIVGDNKIFENVKFEGTFRVRKAKSKWFGFVGDADESDKMVSLMNLVDCASNFIDKVIFEKKNYIVSQHHKFANTLTKLKVDANGATFKRANEVFTTLSNNIANGVNSFNVVDASVFKENERICVFESTSGYTSTEVSNSYRISDITGNTITIDGTLQGVTGNITQFDAGAKVVRTATLFHIPCKDFQGYNINFDGNIANNGSLPVYWSTSYMLNTAISGNERVFAKYRNVTAKNTTSECIMGGVIDAKKCYFNNLNGSGFHFANNESNQLDYHNTIDDCIFDDVCKSGVNGAHNEGALTYSNSVGKTILKNCKILTSGTGAIGSVAFDDASFVIENCIIKNCADKTVNINIQALSSAGLNYKHIGEILLKNNRFENNAAIEIKASQSLATKDLIKNVTFENNIFYQTGLEITGVSGLNIIGQNKFIDNDYITIGGDSKNINIKDTYFKNTLVYTADIYGLNWKSNTSWIDKATAIPTDGTVTSRAGFLTLKRVHNTKIDVVDSRFIDTSRVYAYDPVYYLVDADDKNCLTFANNEGYNVRNFTYRSTGLTMAQQDLIGGNFFNNIMYISQPTAFGDTSSFSFYGNDNFKGNTIYSDGQKAQDFVYNASNGGTLRSGFSNIVDNQFLSADRTKTILNLYGSDFNGLLMRNMYVGASSRVYADSEVVSATNCKVWKDNIRLDTNVNIDFDNLPIDTAIYEAFDID